MNVAELKILLGFNVDRGGLSRAQSALGSLRNMAMGLGAAFGIRGIGKALIGFNANVETAKNQIASMLSFAKGTSLTAELTNANTLYDNLRKKAAELPGSTQDYIQMLSMISQPLAGAGASLKQMEDITVRSLVLSKGLGENWQKSARDLRELINFGKLSSVDTFSRTLLSSAGIDANDAGRAKLKGMSKAERLALVEKQLAGPQITSMIDAQAKSFTGRLERLQDTATQILGRIGKKLFDALGPQLAKLAKWLDENQAKIEEWADSVGGAIADAFEWLVDNKDTILDVLKSVGIALGILAVRAAALALAAGAPFVILTGLVQLFRELTNYVSPLSAAFITLGVAIAGAFSLGKIKAFIAQLQGVAPAAANAAGAVNGGAAAGSGMGKLAMIAAPIAAASIANDLTGGSFQDQARAKGWKGEDWDIMGALKFRPDQDIARQSGSTNTNTASTIVNAPITINGAMDPTVIGQAVQAQIGQVTDAANSAMRNAQRALTGNRNRNE